MNGEFSEEKAKASDWFRQLRDQICDAFEAVEDSQTTGRFADQPAGRFELTPTQRNSENETDAGGGLMSVMRGGRVFEKVGVNISTVYGTLNSRAVASMAAKKNLPDMHDDPRFWASG
ncbi:MAG TPA: coproporphyrinogen III oxidase, partial [Rhodobacteraceae bacterium]|nr:coproporphyrinogen III oxidase [Paracoccaceae bacterium]